MSRRCALLACLIASGCFNPEDPALETDAGSTGEASTGSSGTPTTASTTTGSEGSTGGGSTETTDPTVADTGSGSESSSSGGESLPDWGEGEPPDFGDLGEDGQGDILVVHALSVMEPLDVWLVGTAEPAATDLQPGDAVRLEGIDRDARRVVLARAGTLEAVGCSAWFPLRADEQWATVATRGAHDCTDQGSGSTPTFEQALALSGNTVRFVHGGRPDPLGVASGGVPEGMLAPGETLEGSDLPDCEASGCSIGYTVSSMGIGAPRHFTFATNEVSDVPPPGELMLVILGDVRQDWPAEPNAIAALAVTVEGGTRVLRRDPEVAFVAPETTADVTFSIPTPPSSMEVAVSGQCDSFGDDCLLGAHRFAPGMQDLFASGPAGFNSGTYDLAAGERYVLVYTPDGEQVLLRDTFTRDDQAVSLGRVVNWTNELLTIGRVFNNSGQAFPNFENVPAGEVSDEDEVPDGSWDLVSSVGGGPLGTGCFQFAETPAPWRGFFWEDGHINLDAWPPTQTARGTICS